MRNTSKMTTLENRFPLLAVEHGCIISKDADITVAFEVELPELYTVTGAEYEAIHGCWCKAIKVLPDFCVVHKQDWFIKERYKPELQKEDMSFLSRSNERHFNERPYLKHTCYLYLTKTTKERNRMQSNFSTLCRGHIIPKELDKETVGKFMEAAEQFERIMNDSGFVRLRRLSTDEIVGTEKSAGLIERYFSLMPEGNATLQDIDLSAREMRIGDNRLCLHTLSDAEDMPGKVATDIRYEKLSTDRSDCRLSFASPVGLLLSCNHIYNQYVIIDNSEENLQKFEKSARNMQSLSRYSRSNSINREWIDQYLNEAHSYGLTSVRAHFNVMAWSDDAEELKHIKNDVGSQLASMECVPRHNTIDCPTLYWAAMPGNASVQVRPGVGGLRHRPACGHFGGKRCQPAEYYRRGGRCKKSGLDADRFRYSGQTNSNPGNYPGCFLRRRPYGSSGCRAVPQLRGPARSNPNRPHGPAQQKPASNLSILSENVR